MNFIPTQCLIESQLNIIIYSKNNGEHKKFLVKDKSRKIDYPRKRTVKILEKKLNQPKWEYNEKNIPNMPCLS